MNNAASETQWSVTQLQQINRISTAFDGALKKGERPQIEAYLRECPESLRDEVLKSLLRLELKFHQPRGSVAPLEHYLTRYPQQSAIVCAAYREVVTDHGPQATVAPQVTQAPSPSEVQPPTQSLRPSPNTRWYYLRNQMPVGPFTFEQVQKLARVGDLRPKDLVCEEGKNNWVEAGGIPFLFGGILAGAGKAPAPGQSIRDDYILLELVGRGGMGEVYKAYRFSLQREVALKIIRHDRFQKLSPARQQHLLECFGKEMQRTAKLRHDNIVTIHDTGDHNGLPFYTLDLVETNLAKILHHSPLPGKKAAEFMEKVAQAVDFAHGQHIIHRDLKPHNILLDKGKPLLADLGLAAVHEELLEGQDQGQIVGTPSYMAPEQARGGKVDQRTDVYGLGATLYHLITGRPPHQSPDRHLTIRQVITVEPLPPRKLNPAIDRDLEAITLKCLEKDPEKRYATAGMLAEDLQRYLQGHPVSAKRPTLWDRVQKWARREPLKASLAGGIVLLLLILFGYGSWSNSRLSAALDVAQEETKRAEKHAADAKRSQELAQEETKRAEKHAAEAKRLEDQATLERKRAIEIADILGARVLNKYKLRFLDPENVINEMEKSRSDWERRLKGQPPDSMKLDLADTLRTLSNLYAQKQELPKAIECLEQCVGLQKELSRNYLILKFELGLNYLDLAGLYEKDRKREKVLDSDQRALHILEEVEAEGIKSPLIRRVQAEAHVLLGGDLTLKGDYEKALEHQKRSVAMLKELSDTEKGTIAFSSIQKELGNAYHQLGRTLSGRGDVKDALFYLKQAKEVFEGKAQFRKNLADVNLELGRAYIKLKDTEPALEPLEQAEAAFQELLKELPGNSPQAPTFRQPITEVISLRGKAFQVKKDYVEAEKFLKQSLRLREELYRDAGKEWVMADGYADLAELYREAKKPEDATRAYYDQAIAAQEAWVKKAPQDYASQGVAGAFCHNQGVFLSDNLKDADALGYFQRAKNHWIRVFEQTKSPGYEKNLESTFRELKATQLRLNRLPDAFLTVVDKTRVWKNDPVKYRAAIRELAETQQRPEGAPLLPALIGVVELGLKEKLLTTDWVSSEPVLQGYRTEPAFQALLQKYRP